MTSSGEFRGHFEDVVCFSGYQPELTTGFTAGVTAFLVINTFVVVIGELKNMIL